MPDQFLALDILTLSGLKAGVSNTSSNALELLTFVIFDISLRGTRCIVGTAASDE
jgi:hypothetical protein